MNKITITFRNNRQKEYEKGTTYYEISKEIKNPKNPILGVKINNEISSLDTKALQNAKVSFFDVQDLAGYKMYQSALKFIFEVAVKELYPECEVHFLHSVPKGILSEIITPENLTNKELNEIKAKMAEIVSSKELFQKYNILKKDAYNYFLANNEIEKAKNIQNISNEIVTLYKLRNKINYYYNFMPHDTGSITKYDLIYIGKNRIILVCPSL